MTKFLFIASDYKPQPGGIAAYLDTLVRGLCNTGFKARVLAVVEPEEKEKIEFLQSYEEFAEAFPIVHRERPESWIGNNTISALEILRCQRRFWRRLVEKIPFFKPSADSLNRLAALLRREHPAMVVFGHLDLRLYALALLLQEQRVPYAIIAHDFEVYRNPARKNDFVRRGCMLNGASLVVANSEHTKSLLKEWNLSDDRVTVVHPPITQEAISAGASADSRASDRPYTLITMARLVRVKGIDLVLHALKDVIERGIECRYVIVGDGDERAALEKLANELGLRNSTEFMGHVSEDEKWSLLRDSDVYVMPSRVNVQDHHEGFGLSFVEAAAFGVPAIGTRAGGIPEAVLESETGLLIQPESQKELADAIAFFYWNPVARKQMGQAARERAATQFSPRATATQFAEAALGATAKEPSAAGHHSANMGFRFHNNHVRVESAKQ